MEIKYNSLNRLEKPTLILCNPGSTYHDGLLTGVVGMLRDHSDEEIIFNFNTSSEFNFRLYKIKHSDYTAEEQTECYNLYRAVQNRRLIYVKDIGFFMIMSIEDGFDGHVQYKDVKAKSIDVEIEQKMVPYIADGTYKLYQPSNGIVVTQQIPAMPVDARNDDLGGTTWETGRVNDDPEGMWNVTREEGDGASYTLWDHRQDALLNKLVRSLPLWEIGEVESTVAERWRTFTDVDVEQNCLNFLITQIQDAYECLVLFDIEKRIINVYDQANYIKQTKIHLTKDDVIESLNITENADDIYTAISVLGGDNVTIAAINPLGTNVIYDFSYYLSWMPAALAVKVEAWQDAVEAVREDYHDITVQYYELLEEASNIQLEIQRLNTMITMYQRCRDNIVAEGSTALVSEYNKVIVENGGDEITIHELIADTLAEIDALIADYEQDRSEQEEDLEELNEQITTIRTQIIDINDTYAITNYFTAEEYGVLNHYIFEGAYRDEYIVLTDIMTYEEKFEQMEILYDRAKAQLDKVSVPTQQFTVDVESFIFSKEFEAFSDELETGCLVNVELEPGNIAMLFLSTITINFDDHSLSLTFGNRYNKFDPKSLFDNVLGKIDRSANTLNYVKELLTPMSNGEFNEMQAALQSSRDLTMASALASTGEEVIIDGSGYTGRRLLPNGNYDPRQVKLTGKSMVFTDDAWESCKVAIGEILLSSDGDRTNGTSSVYGVNAEAIVGDMIMGNNLRILDNHGNDIFSVVDGRITASIQDISGRLAVLEQTADGVNIRIAALEDAEVDHVLTTTGFSFGADGLVISRTGDEITSKIDNTGIYVDRGDLSFRGEQVLTANNEGVQALNLTARQYLIVGDNARFENYDDGTDHHRTACFYIE